MIKILSNADVPGRGYIAIWHVSFFQTTTNIQIKRYHEIKIESNVLPPSAPTRYRTPVMTSKHSMS